MTAIAVADGLPPPLAGVTDGPGGDTLRQVAEGYGLACQADAGIGGPELFCIRSADDHGLTLVATFYTDPALVLEASAYGTAPLPEEATTFLREMTAPFCADANAMAAFIDGAMGSGTTQTSLPYEADGCRLDMAVTSDASTSPPFASGRVLAFATGAVAAPTSSASASGAASEAASPSAGPVGVPDDTPANPDSGALPPPFVRSVATPASVSRDPLTIVESVLLALLVVALMPFPAQLFNSTLEEHYDEVRGWFRLRPRDAGPPPERRDPWSTPIGIVGFLVLSGLLYGLLDPTFGADLASLAELTGMVVGIGLTTFLFVAPMLLLARRRGASARFRALPGTLLVGIACVGISRLTGFAPGYLYGLVIGLVVGLDLAREEEGRQVALAAVVMLLAALGAWALLGALAGRDLGPVGIALDTALAAVLVAGLEGVVFGLLPLRFLPGERLYGWSRPAWAVLLGIGAFAFFHILINPASGYLADTTRGSLLTIVALLVGFGIVSVAFWSWFRFRAPRGAA